MGMNRTRKLVVTGVVGATVALGVGGAALASGGADSGDDGDVTVTGSQADRATRAALQITGGGHANWWNGTPRTAPPERSRSPSATATPSTYASTRATTWSWWRATRADSDVTGGEGQAAMPHRG